MTLSEFDNVIELVISFLEQDCIINPESYRKSGEDFEPCVKRAVDFALEELGLPDEVDYTPGGHGFPDIVIVGADGNKYGMMVIKNTAVFIDSFKKAACSENMSYAYGKVKYDLDERMEDVSYFDDAMKDSFESVFHKTKIPYEIQNEIRFSVIDLDNPPFLELQLNKTNTLFFDILPMIKGKGVMIKLTDLEFGEDNSLPVRFSSKIQYYVPEENNGDT